MQKRLLLTGASGFLGWNVCREIPSAWGVTGVYNTKVFEQPPVTTLQTDITDSNILNMLLSSLKPDGIMHLAAAANPNFCEEHPDSTRKINVNSSIQLAEWAAAHDIPFVFTSTDLVFDGKKGMYEEQDEALPLCQYGHQKLEAEKRIAKAYPAAAICRMPLMYGYGGPHASNFFMSSLQNIREGKEVNLFTDEFRTAISGRVAARGLWHALENFQGLYHLGGNERMSRFEFGAMMAEIFQLPLDLFNAVLQKDVQMPAARPKDVSLNNEKAVRAGFKPSDTKTELRLLAEDLRHL